MIDLKDLRITLSENCINIEGISFLLNNIKKLTKVDYLYLEYFIDS